MVSRGHFRHQLCIGGLTDTDNFLAQILVFVDTVIEPVPLAFPDSS